VETPKAWTHGIDATVLVYSVPAVINGAHPFSMIRPNPGPNGMMVFSPNLIRGGGKNLNTDITRVSVEMRFGQSSQKLFRNGL
jgi:hypothetical protein